MSTQVNFHLQITTLKHTEMLSSVGFEVALRNALRKVILDTVEAAGAMDTVLTIRGPEVVSLF